MAMAVFEFIAVDTRGTEQRGVLEADGARQVRQQLRDRHWLPLSVTPLALDAAVTTSRNRARWRTRWQFTQLSASDMALMTRQLATLVRAALPLEEALLAVSQQSAKPLVQRVLAAVRSRVIEGESLAAALGQFPRLFPEIYRATVAAGEQSGKLDEVLERLADYSESRDLLRQRLQGALLYPIVLTMMSIAIVAGLLTYVVPKVVTVFESTQGKLPWLTRLLLAGSDFLRDFGLWVLLLLGLAAVGFWRWLRDPVARHRCHALILRSPVFGRLARGFNTARFTRTLSILTGSAVPVLEGLQIAAAVIGNLPMREAAQQAADRVREGAAIGRSLGASGLFPPMTVHLISSGESSGRLEEMLERAAAQQERELDGMLDRIVGLLGPLMIVAMGLIVMAIVFAMLLPIFEMNTLIR